MPEQTFQYFVPVGSTSVSITAAMFGAGGVTLDVETTQQFTYLIPGTGFTAPEAAMTPIGVSGATGYDCTAIARWDVVPWQVAEDGFMVGVIAYHREGIDKVQFALNGGPWVDVTQMSMNQRTNEMEFSVGLKLTSIPNDDIEVRARVIPTVGIPRILAGGISGISAGSLNTGNHSMFLQSAGTTRPEFFVSPNGSDSTGLSGGFSAGTRQNPYQTIPYALYTGAAGGIGGTDVSGSILTLLPGDHYYSFAMGEYNERIYAETSWVTIRSDYSEPSSITRFTGYTANSWAGRSMDKIHIQNMQFVQPTGETNWASFSGTYQLWIDTCDIQGQFEPVVILPSYSNKWATDCTAVDIKGAPFGNRITRNCHIDGLLEDAFGPEELLLNSSVARQSREQTAAGNSGSADPYHPDVWSKFLLTDTGSVQYVENVIIRDLTANDRIEAQGLFFKGNWAAYRDIAVVNANINNSWTFNPTNDEWLVGQENYQACFPLYVSDFVPEDVPDYKHLLVSNCSMWSSGIGATYGTTGGVDLVDVVFKNNIVLNSGSLIAGSNVLLPSPDGKAGAWSGIWRGPTLDALPWTSSTSTILYLE